MIVIRYLQDKAVRTQQTNPAVVDIFDWVFDQLSIEALSTVLPVLVKVRGHKTSMASW